MKCITIVSGGLDSSVLVHFLAQKGYDQHLISFNYGQRQKKELLYASLLAEKMRIPHDIVDISAMQYLLGGSALTDNVDVPDGHYAEENMKITIVPNRNAVMLSIAYACAVAEHAQYVAFGAHNGDFAVYPDCRPAFVEKFQHMEQAATETGIMMLTPFIYQTKADIVREGDKLGVDFAATWSCYKGGDIACARCGTCVERIGAFIQAGVEDPLEYEDKEFALQVLKEHGDI